MTIHNRKLKLLELTIGGESFECQLKNWQIVNGTGDGDRIYTFCPDGEDREDAEDEYSLELEFFSDWRSGGVSDFLTLHDKATASFQIDHHPDIDAEHVRWTGEVKLRAPNVGGEARSTEMTSVTLQIIGKPDYSRPGESS